MKQIVCQRENSAPRGARSTTRDYREAWRRQIVGTVMGEERRPIQQRRGGDPSVRAFHSPTRTLGGDHDFGPLSARIRAGRDDGKSPEKEPKPVRALRAPAMLKCPTLELGDGHERDQR